MYFYLRLGTFFGQNFFQKYRNKISYYLVNLSGLSTFHFEHHPVNYVINNIRYTTLFLILYRRQVVLLRQLPLVQRTLSNSLNYLPPVQY